MRYWNSLMLGTLKKPEGSKGKIMFGADPGSSAQVAVPPLVLVPPVGTEVPPPPVLPLLPAFVEGEDEQAASRTAAIPTLSAIKPIALSRRMCDLSFGVVRRRYRTFQKR